MEALLIIVLFAACDRFAGGPYIQKLGWPGRPVWYATLVMAAAMAALGHFFAGTYEWAWVALAWFVWREPKWKLFGGSLTPQTLGEALGFTLRHLLFLGLAAVAWRLGNEPAIAALIVLGWALLASLLGVWLDMERDHGEDVNWAVETLRGALQGVAVAAVLLWI